MRTDGIGGEVTAVGGEPGTSAVAPVAGADETNFTDALELAVGALDSTQAEADVEATKLAMGGGNLHETALALEKADVAMRVAVKVRNKAVDAYQELMRMSV